MVFLKSALDYENAMLRNLRDCMDLVQSKVKETSTTNEVGNTNKLIIPDFIILILRD